MEEQSLPYMHNLEIEAIKACLRSFNEPAQVLEWGSGNSTLFFPGFLPEGSVWYAIEHHDQWANDVEKRITSHNRKNIELFLVRPNLPFQGDSDGDFATFRDYVLFPKILGKTFDFILVDGRARVECLQVGWTLLSKDGIMVLHDAQRVGYHRGIPGDCAYIRIMLPVMIQSEGCISVFFICKSNAHIIKLASNFWEVLPSDIYIDIIYSSECFQEENEMPQFDFHKILPMFEQGMEYLRVGNPASALSSFNLVLGMDSDLPNVHYARAAAWLALGRQVEALQDLQRELKLNPDHQHARRLLWKNNLQIETNYWNQIFLTKGL